MAKDKNYTGNDIVQLTDREHVRLRTNVYLGNMHPATYTVPVFVDNKFVVKQLTFIPAVYKALNEIIDNSLDEFSQITSKDKTLTLDGDPSAGHFIVEDTGRGIPIDKHPSGLYTPEVALGSLRAGRNFTSDKEIGVIGQNGVGAACTNYCSQQFSVQIRRNGKLYQQTFSEGAGVVSKPMIASASKTTTGTRIEFQLDPSVFSSVELPQELFNNRAIEIAATNPDVTIQTNGNTFHFKKGFEELVNIVTTSDVLSSPTYHCFKLSSPTIEGQFFVIFGMETGIDEQMFTYVNSSLLFDGGICNTQFLNGFYDNVISHLQSAAKKNQCEVTKNDVKQNLLVLANLRVTNPEYDAQSKTRLTGPSMRKEIDAMFSEQWKSFVKKNDAWLQVVLERATVRHHTVANKKAIDEHQKGMRKRVPGLLDATSKFRPECQLLITEGDSAKSQISEARNPQTTAAFALRGKVNNVHGMTPAQVLKMDKITDLLSAIGLTPGKRAMRSELRYGRVVIATDADYDGDDIFTLLVNLFFHFWPELFDSKYEPYIFRLVAPNVVASKNGKRVHFTTRTEYEGQKTNYSGWTIEYMKGLGSMNRVDWEMILSEKTDTQIPIIDDGHMRDTMVLLFGDNADKRKEWLQTYEQHAT